SKYYLEKGRGKSKLHKWFYEQEATRFRSFENVLNQANLILTMSPNDYANYSLKFKQKVHYLPSFHSESTYSVPEGTGHYCLFHAKLDKKINHESAMFLIEHVFNELPFNLIIAGNGAHKALRKTIQDYSNVQLIENLTGDDIRKLVKEAQVNCIPAIRTTGMKHFLLHLFFNGRYIVTSENELEGMGFDGLFESAKNPYEWQTKISELMSRPLQEQEFEARYNQLNLHYNNRFNASVLYSLILEDKPIDMG
ncbi:MAG: hypothetical protein ACOVP1_05555, partial [Bacteroidia bacterium]